MGNIFIFFRRTEGECEAGLKLACSKVRDSANMKIKRDHVPILSGGFHLHIIPTIGELGTGWLKRKN